MKILFHKNFVKAYEKLGKGEKRKFKGRRHLFLQNPFHPLLNNHALQGKYQGYRSINVGGDLRAIYKELKKDLFLLADIDTHSNLYGK